MSLITALGLKKAVNNCPETLKRITEKIGSPEFEKAAFAYENDKADYILEKEMCRLLDAKDEYLHGGLEDYCKKFGINEDLSKLDNIRIILKISEHRDEIDRKLKFEGL